MTIIFTCIKNLYKEKVMNYYQILGLESTVNDLEIKSAYRRLAMLYHPDRINGDDIKFKLVNEDIKHCLVKKREKSMILTIISIE